jgi:large subunit ribosomal protein L34
MPKRTYQPKIRRRARVHGFRARMATATAGSVEKPASEGRYRLAVTKNNHVKHVNWNS